MQVNRKDRIHFSCLHCSKCIFCRCIGNGLKLNIHALKLIGGMHQIILQCTGKLPGLLIRLTEGKIIIPVSDTDRPMILQPVLLVRHQGKIRSSLIQAFFRDLFTEIRILVLDSAQGHIQICQDIRTVLIYCIEIIRSADPADRNGPILRAHGINRGISVQFSICHQTHGLIFFQHQRYDLKGKAVILFPIRKKALLNTVFIDTDPFSVQR